jgi:uncharacterized protein (TIGR02453 family)
MTNEARFTPALFKFLGQLKKHNDRDWFAAHKAEYERVAQDPFCAFILQVRKPLMAISPYLVADERPHRGSLHRVYRDIRFSKNKAPYKTNIAASFWNRADKERGPGIYLHLQPDHSFIGAGLWMPDREALLAMRRAIVEQPKQWRKAVAAAAPDWERSGERLSRPPKGFPADHPQIEELKWKSFILITRLSEKEIYAPDFPATFIKRCKQAAPLMAFVTRAIGLPWSKDDAPSDDPLARLSAETRAR